MPYPIANKIKNRIVRLMIFFVFIRRNLIHHFSNYEISTLHQFRCNAVEYNFAEITIMKFITLEPFVPSGENFEGSKQLFLKLGFTITWDAGDYTGFQKDGCKFIL